MLSGGQWAVLQSTALMGMIVAYSQKVPLPVAVHETFDVRHPYFLCKAIASAQRTETQSALHASDQKLEFPPLEECTPLRAPTQFHLLPMAGDTFADSLAQRPLLHPPRGLFV